MENNIDRKIYKADLFRNSQGGNAIDVLKYMPSVTIDSEGDLTMRGQLMKVKAS